MINLDKPPKTSAGVVVRNTARVGLLCLCLSCVSIFMYGQAVLLNDIGTQEYLALPNEYSELTNAHERLYFIGFNTELWTSSEVDGIEDTRLLKRFKSISTLTVAGKWLYFIADDGISGPELWKTNGSEDGTVRVKDIRNGAQGSNIRFMTNVYGTLYFSANDGKHGQELWRSSGGSGNTVMVKDIMPDKGSGSPGSLTDLNGTLFFSANDGIHGYELWKSNGTASGTVLVRDVRIEPGMSSSPQELENVKGILFFAAHSSGSGSELWRSDGTSAGTWLVKDIRPGPAGSGIGYTTAVHTTLFFTATDGIHGQELWKTDGTASGTVLVKDMAGGPGGILPDPPFASENFVNMYGTLYFTALVGGLPHVCKSDGTEQGTILIAQSCGQDSISLPLPHFTWLDNTVYFIIRSDRGPATYQLWTDQGLPTDIEFYVDLFGEVPRAYHPEMVRVKEHLYISGRPYYFGGFKIVKTRGRYEDLVPIKDIQPKNTGSDPGGFAQYEDLVYFNADHAFYTQDNLWVTDGTPEGTREVFGFDSKIIETEVVGAYFYCSGEYGLNIYQTDLRSGITEYFAYDFNHGFAWNLTGVNESLYFLTESGTLWMSNGTTDGTTVLQSFHSIRAMDALNNSLLFRVLLEDGTEELWSSDGSSASTVKLKTLHTGAARESTSYPSSTIGDTYYFVANDGVHGNELWKSRGTASSTSMVVDVNTGDAGVSSENDIRTFVAFRDSLYFSAVGSDGIWSLYKSNGTATGTIRITNIGPVAYAVAEGTQLYLFVNRSADDLNTELWKTDGTANGTTQILDLNDSSGTFHHKMVDGWLYFSISEGGDLWRTDGTTCGTTPVNHGVVGGYPIEAINSTLIFGAYTDERGQEPYAFNTAQIPDAPCDDSFAGSGAPATLTSARQKNISSYPNPFTSEFALRIDGSDHEFALVKVVSLAGYPVETTKSLSLNTDHNLGKSWAPGVYLIHIQSKDKVITHMVVKE